MRYISRFKNSIRASSVYSLAFMLTFALAAGLTTYEEAVAQPSVTLTVDTSIDPGTQTSIDESQGANNSSVTVTVTATATAGFLEAQIIELTLSGSANMRHPDSTNFSAANDYALNPDDREQSGDNAGKIILNIGASSNSANPVLTGTKNLRITLNDDNQFEQPETIVVSGSLSGSVVTPATIMVIDDDYDITLAAEVTVDGEISENAAIPVAVAVTANLASTRTNPVTVSLNFAGTAASSYYTAAGTHSITIAAGMSTGTANVTIDPEDNTTRGGDKTIIIGGTSSGLNVKPANAVTISDNEQAPTVSISADPSKISEGAGRTTVIMSAKLTGALLEEAAAIKLANITMPDDEMDATGTASADDYDLTGAKAITIPALSESGSTPMSFTPDPDAYFEGDETIIISGSNDALTVANMLPMLTLTIVDDDFDILLSLDNSMVSEDASDAVELEVTATLTGGTRTSDLSVPLAVGTEDGYIFQINDSDADDDNITIKAGERSGTAKVTVTVETNGNDVLYAGNKTVDITVPTDPPEFVLNAKPTTITLVDDEEKPTITLSLDNSSITEGGSETVSVTANVSGQLAEQVTVTLGFGGTAELDEATNGDPAKDYRLANASPTLTILASADASIQVSAGITLTDDGAFEHDETIVISGSASGYEIDPVTVTVVDDDYDIDLSFVDVTINEAVEDAATVAVIATLQSARTNPITITLMFSGTASSSEYVVGGTTTITVPPGQVSTTGMANVTIDPVDNNLRGGNKTIKISGTAEGINVKAADETITIMDDEQAPTVTLKVEPAKLNEDAGTVSVVVTAELSGDGSAPLASAATIELTVDAADVDDSGEMVTEANDNDFSVSGTKSITIPARASSGSTRLSVTVVDDPLFEMEETITVAGKTDAPVANNDGETPPGIASKTISIVDDDFDIKLSVDTSSIAEDASGTPNEPGDPVKVKVTATQSGSRTSDITVMVAYTMDENTVADIVAAAGSITIDAGDMSGEIEVSINPSSLNNEGYEGDRTINVGGISISAGYNIQGTSITIADDEEKPTVTLAVTPDFVNEGANGNGGTVAVTATLKPNGLTAGTTITLDLSGTAVRVELATDESNMDAYGKRDYNATITNITVQPNMTDATGGSVDIMARNDDEFEADKTIIVSGKSDDVASVSDATIMLINDDYDVRITLPATEADRTVMENAADPVTIPVTATLDAAKTSPVTVELRFSGTAMASEYVVGGTTTITLGAGVTTAMANVTIDPVDDELRGGDKTIEVTGVIPGSDLNIQKAANSIKLMDDEDAPTVVISLSPDKLGEDAGAASVTVKAELKDGAPLADTATITVKMDPSDVAGMAGEKDFSVSGSLDIMVPAGIGWASTTVTVNVVDDPTFEGDETIDVTASTDAPVAIADDTVTPVVQIAAKTLTIVDNDFDVKLTVSPNSVTEGGDVISEASDATDVTVTATLAGTRTSDVTVDVAYMMGTVNIQDGVADGGDMIEISAGDMSGEATVSITTTTLHNATYEGDRTIDVEGEVTNLNVQPTKITIADDEVKPTVKLVLDDDDKNIDEDAGGNILIEVTAEISPNGLTEPATITLELGGTAAREDDDGCNRI